MLTVPVHWTRSMAVLAPLSPTAPGRQNSSETMTKKIFLWITPKPSPFVRGSTHSGSRATSGPSRPVPAVAKAHENNNHHRARGHHVLDVLDAIPPGRQLRAATPTAHRSRSARAPGGYPPSHHTAQAAPTTTTQSSDPSHRRFHSPRRRRATHTERISAQRHRNSIDKSHAPGPRARTHSHAASGARLTL